jgi:ribosomal protein L32E
MSEVLDDERKEAFHLALHGLKEEKEEAEVKEAMLRQQQQEQMEQRRKESEARRLEQSRAEDERRKREEENRRQPRGSDEVFRRPVQHRQVPSQSSRTSRPAAKKAVSPPPGLYHRLSAIISSMQTLVANTAHSMTANPMAFFRTILFLLAFALAFGRQDLRERIMRIIRNAWDKVRRTVGMGVKVSYI